MMKYIIVACLCLMLVLGQVKSQDQQETTTDKRVERDTDWKQIPQGFPMPALPLDKDHTISDMMNTATDKLRTIQNAMSSSKSRRRRSSEQQ